MISLRVFIVTLALAVKLENVRAAHTWTSPVSFSYKPDVPYDIISVNIILQNVPAEADRYVLYYQTDNCDRNATAQHPAAGCDEPAIGTIPTDRKITIMRTLDRASLRIYIVLRNENKICATKRIMDGVRDDNANENQFSKDCLNKNVCDIIADFGNQCEEQTLATIRCSQHEEHLTCEVVGEVIPEDTVHQWYQVYTYGSLIGTIPAVKGSKTEFKMTIHKFDINTYISSTMKSAHWEKKLRSVELKVPLPKNGYKNYHVEHKKKYTENELISFNCSNNAHTQIAVIEPTGNRITTFNKTTLPFNLTKEGSGSMLCCLNYQTYTLPGNKRIVERTVTDITVLIYYEEPVNQSNNVNTSDLPVNTSPSNRAPETHHNTFVQRQEVPTSPSPSSSADPPLDKIDETNYYIAIAAVAGVILLTSLIYVIGKKCWRKSSDPEQTVQLETYASTNMVQYAELDIRPGTRPAPASPQDATYAEIIGVLRPENGHAKK